MSDMHTCPRRGETGMDDPTSPFRGAGRDLDEWDARDGYRACSYCGSLHPDDFMAYARSGRAELIPTDKSYKVYVRDPRVTYQPTRGSSDDVDADGKIIMRPFGPRAVTQMKFYLQHLDDAQRTEFIDLYNVRPRRTYEESYRYSVAPSAPAKGMAVGYPGYFYVLPFFATQGPA